MQRRKYWHRLDNAAKVFPAISKNGNSNVFRIAFYLKEQINPNILSEAVNIALKRFQTINIQLRSGIFWNYFSENKHAYIVEEESHIVCNYFKFNQNKGFLFKVYYLNNKISLETFHALTDGAGALEFLKAITFEYLILMGYRLNHDNLILTRKPVSNKETEDSFLKVYDKKIKKKLKEDKAYHLDGDKFKDNWSLVFKISANKNEIIKMVKEKYQATITEYFTALLAHSIYLEASKSKKPIKMFVPVNLRPFFDSITLRNFSLYVKANYSLEREWEFEEMIDIAKKSFAEQLVKEELQMHLGTLVSLEKNFFVRFVPLFIKNWLFKIGFKMLGSSINTSSLSNLGIVNLPKDLEKHVTDVDFINSGPGMNFTLVTYLDTFNLIINSSLKDISIIKNIVDKLKEDNIDIIIDTNYLEEYDEIL